jgi:hypothetical protein
MASRGGRIDGNVLIRRWKVYACMRAQGDVVRFRFAPTQLSITAEKVRPQSLT